MNGGLLDTKIAIFKPVTGRDSSGQTELSYELHGYTWAKIEYLDTIKDSEREMNEVQEVAFGVARATLRYRTDITPSMRLKTEYAEFEVVGMPIHKGRKEWTLLNIESRDNLIFYGT